MKVKIGDFGLATEITFDGERKRTLCGTPNYIAPEILTKQGHSHEVDIWSTGCIMYTLLVGKPPFETESLKETYKRIKQCEYIIPEDKVGSSAQHLITSMLAAKSTNRPKVREIIEHEFIKVGYMPRQLPTSALTVAPQFTDAQLTFSTTTRLMPADYEKENDEGFIPRPVVRKSLAPQKKTLTKQEEIEHNKDKELKTLIKMTSDLRQRFYDAKMEDKHITDQDMQTDDNIQHPASAATYWVSKWVDYSDKYGIGYQLCDNSVGVLFNDNTRIVLHEDAVKCQYVDKDYNEQIFTIDSYPSELKKKVSLVKYFRNYMNEHLLKAGSAAAPAKADDLSRLPMLRTWFRTRSAICLSLSNGTVQINWFDTHQKLVFCPKMEAITELLGDGYNVTYKKSMLQSRGFSKDFDTKMKYCEHMFKKLAVNAGEAGRQTQTVRGGGKL